jgi:hypothetical protein
MRFLQCLWDDPAANEPACLCHFSMTFFGIDSRDIKALRWL